MLLIFSLHNFSFLLVSRSRPTINIQRNAVAHSVQKTFINIHVNGEKCFFYNTETEKKIFLLLSSIVLCCSVVLCKIGDSSVNFQVISLLFLSS